MRTILLTTLLFTMAFAGCISGDGLDTDSLDATTQGETAADFYNASHAEKPEKRWEPKWIFDVKPGLVVAQGEPIEFEWDISDMGDYEYPTDFMDYTLSYEGAPTPLAEGSALDLPGSINYTLFKVGFHNFTLVYDDGQGVTKVVNRLIQVGDPCGENPDGWNCPELPLTIPMVDRTLEQTITVAASCNHVCTATMGGTVEGEPVPLPCPGLANGVNGAGCVWMSVTPDAAGAPLTVTGVGEVDNDPDAVALESCDVTSAATMTYGAIGGEAGVVPEGTGCIVAWMWGDPVGDITIKVGPWEAPDLGSAFIEDAAEDTESPITDILSVSAYLTEDTFEVDIGLATAAPTPIVATPVSYTLYLNGNSYITFGRYPHDNSPLVWNSNAGGYMTAGSSTWDADHIKFHIPRDIAGSGPYTFHVSANYGALTNTVPTDYAPDDGELTI